MDIITLSADEIRLLADELEYARAREATVRFIIDGGLKFKVGEGMWTAPLGETTQRT